MNSVINGIKDIHLRKVCFAFFCMLVVHAGFAQDTTATEESKLKFSDKINHWAYAYGLSNPEFMAQRQNDFKASAYAEVYIEGIIDHKAWMFTLLNKITMFRHQEKQTPHLVFEVKFKPSTDALDNYTVTLTLQKSGEISQNLESIAAAASEKYFKGKSYADPSVAVDDIERALTEALDEVEEKLGDVLAPNLMVRYQNEIFWNGHEIPILDSEGNSVELEAIGKDGNLLDPDQITWTNADPFQSGGIVDMTGVNSKSVTLTKQGDTKALNVTVVRAGSQDDINELLKMLIVEVLTTKKQEALDSITILKRDSINNANALIAQIAHLESGNLAMEDIGVKPVALFSTPPVVSARDEEAFEDGNDRKAGFEHLRKRIKLKNTIRKKVNVVALANLIVDQPEKINILLDGLLLNSGSLVARLILNRDSQGKRDEARNIVIDFLNENLEEIAGSHFAQTLEPEPPIPVPPAPTPPSFTFSPEEPLYVSPMVAFEGKETFIDEMKAYLSELEPRVYVAINYSQDVSTESYLNRVQGARPRGIQEGQNYIAITLVNIPGSIEYQLSIAANVNVNTSLQASANIAFGFWDVLRSAQKVTIQSHITQRLQELKNNFQADYLAILHCESCETQTSSGNIWFSNIYDITQIPELNITSPIPFIFGNKNVVAEKVERITGQAKACFILYFKSTDEFGVDLTQSETGLDINDFTAPLLIVFDRENRFRELDCTSQLGTWSTVICPAQNNAQTDLTDINGTYVSDLVSHVEACLLESPGRIHNYTSGRLSLQDEAFINQLYSGDFETTWGRDGEVRHNTKATLILTDYLSGEQALTAASDFEVPSGETKIWLHKNQEGLWELKSQLPERADDFFEIKNENDQNAFTLRGLLNGLGETLDLVATGVYEFMDWSAKGIAKARIPDYAWNCNAEQYNEKYVKFYKYAASILAPIATIVKEVLVEKIKRSTTDATVVKCLDDLKDSKVEFAFVCGLWNGVVEIGRSVPEIGKLLVGPLSRKGRTEFSNFLDQLDTFKKEDINGNEECSGTWCAIKTGFMEEFNPSNCCKFAEIIGELVIPIAISWIDPAALAGAVEGTSARIILNIVKILQWLDRMGDPFTALKMSLRFVNSSLSVVRSQAGKILIRIENQVVKTTVLIEQELVRLSKPLAEVELVADGPLLFAKYTENGVSKTARIIANDLVLVLEQRGVSLAKLSRLLDKVDDMESLLNRLEKTGLRDANLNAFIDDLASTPDLLSHFRQLSVVGEDVLRLGGSWKKLADLGRNQMRKDPSILTSMRKAMDNPDIPSNRLDDIVNSLAESGTRCRTCDNAGTEGLRYVDEVLDDLDGFAKDFKGTSGYDDFLREMGEQGTKATGGSWTLEALMRNRSKYFNGEAISGFEVKHVPGRDFAADIVTNVGGVPHYKEFKSWSSNLMGQSNMIDQITGTMSVINKLDEMKFIFNPSRWTPTASQFKTALQGKSSLLDDLMASGKLQQLMPDEVILSTSDFTDNLAKPKYFDKVFITQ